MPKHNDEVEDRSTFSGHGRVLFLSGDQVRVRFDDNSEESIGVELFTQLDEHRWCV